MHRPTYVNRSSRKHFEGEQFINEFLSARGPGCAFHADADCLCDVDVTLTEGMTFDQVPDCLMNVETAEDLVLEAANIWLNQDLSRPYVNVSDTLMPQLDEFVDMVRSHANTADMEQQLHADIDPHTLALVRDALNCFKPSNRNRPVPVERICMLHNKGYTARMIFEQLREDVEWHPSLGMIYRVLRGHGFKPHNGKPKGYDKASGLTYNEWRVKYYEQLAS